MTSKSDSNSNGRDNVDTWKYHLNYVLKSDDLSEDEKKVVIDGLTKLSRVFNDDWLRQARQQHHPLLSYLLNKAPWSQLWLAEFGKKLEACKELPKFERLEKRLRNNKEYTGAVGEVVTVAKLISAGITDIELHPKVTVEGKEKEPDLKAIVEGETIYFEIVTLGESENYVKARETHLELTFTFFDPEIVRFCQIHKILSKRRIEEFKAKIQRAILEVKESKEYCYIGEPGVLDCLVIHYSKQGESDALVKSFGMKKDLSGPSFDIDNMDNFRRLKLRLRGKNKQLPQDRPGVIVIFANLIYTGSNESFYEDLVYQVEETIYDQDNLIAGIIISGTSELKHVGRVHEKPHYILVTKSHKFLQETVLVIKNRYFKFGINQKILSIFTE